VQEEMREKFSLMTKKSLRQLWERGAVAACVFRKVGSEIRTPYFSTHDDATVKPGSFVNLNINVDAMSEALDTSQSLILSVSYVDIYGRFDYSSEADLSRFVQNALTDIVNICGLQNKATVKAAMSLTANDQKRQCHLPDVWVLEVNGISRLIVEVKSPTKENMVDHPAVCGQLFDYLVAAQSFTGSRAIGVVTDVRDWKVCWLSSDDSLAAAETIEESSLVNTESSPVDGTRLLHAIDKISLNDPQLPKLLASVLLKYYYAPARRLSLLTAGSLFQHTAKTNGLGTH
jgi:hypothetical protein